ncbi:hypothetical protein H0H92_000242 [Tricholoma furcatifolium]|nr:hypothetical protein H0H92_000242 [Tricholoma furcatifolium]
MFLDVEAAESDVDEDGEDGQLDLEGGDFIVPDEEDDADEADEDPSQPVLEDTLRALSIVQQNDDRWDAYVSRARRRAAEALNLSRFVEDGEDLPLRVWRISVHRGREEDIAGLLYFKARENEE